MEEESHANQMPTRNLAKAEEKNCLRISGDIILIHECIAYQYALYHYSVAKLFFYSATQSQ